MEGQTILWYYFPNWYYFWFNNRYTLSLFMNNLRRKIIKHKCEQCLVKSKTQIHHIVPLSEGGSWYKDNVIEVCLLCHCKLHKFGVGRLNHLLKKEVGKNKFEQLREEYNAKTSKSQG